MLDESVARARRLFLYADAEPWVWLPGPWLHAGTIFPTRDGGFFELLNQADDGWECEEVPPQRIGRPERIAEMSELMKAYDRAATARAELQVRADATGETPELQELVRQRTLEMERVQESLVLLCNRRASENTIDDPAEFKRKLVVFLSAVFVLALISCIVSLFQIVPDMAARWVLQAVLWIAALTILAVAFPMLYRVRERLPVAQAAGCLGLVVFTLLVLIMAALLLMVGRHFATAGRPV